MGDFPEIVAIAVTSGYIYDNSRYINSHEIHRNVPVFFNHGMKDNGVNPDGCCHNQTRGCCCGIAQRSNFCTSIHEEFEKWLRWNQCADDIHFDDIVVNQLTETKAAVSCAEAIPRKHGCETPTKLCLYKEAGHQILGREMSMRFLVEALCNKHGGEMVDDDSMSCRCSTESGFGGLFCISSKEALGMELTRLDDSQDTHAKVPKTTFWRYFVNCGSKFLILVLFTTIGLGVWSFCSTKMMAKRNGYTKVPDQDED